MYIEKTLFPVAPGKLSIKVNGTNKTLTLINEGEVNLIKTAGLTELSTEVLLPAMTEYPFAVYPNGFQGPRHYLDKLEKWKQKRKPITFKMLRTSPNGRALLWDTSISVTIEDYEIVEDAGEQGMDVTVKISMLEYREWGAKKLIMRKSKKKKAVLKKGKRKRKPLPKEYMVKRGDSIYAIAKKQLGDGLCWRGIYELNKKSMDSIARSHGHKSAIEGLNCWIFPGERLKLPRKG